MSMASVLMEHLRTEFLRSMRCSIKPEKYLVVIGPRGSGKTTQSLVMKAKHCLCHLDPAYKAAVAAKLPLSIKTVEEIKKGEHVSDDFLVEVINHELEKPECRSGFILDGFPTTLVQSQKLDEILEKHGIKIDKVLNFAIDDKALEERANIWRLLPTTGRIFPVLAPKTPGIAQVIDYYTNKGIVENIPAKGQPGEVMKYVEEALSDVSRLFWVKQRKNFVRIFEKLYNC